MSGKKLNQYHRIAADVLVARRPRSVVSALLQASEEGDYDQVLRLLKQYRGIVDLKCESTGDTPLIAAARAGHSKVVSLLLSYEADCTLQNDAGESVLEVCSLAMRKLILKSITHEGTAAGNPQILLHSAWLGDAVSIKKSVSGTGLDLNCKNSDGLTPMLLVTRDIEVFEKMQHAMKSEYNPVAVLQELMKNDADVNATDARGCTALHMVATNEGVHAKKMVSLLLEAGADPGAENNDGYAPLHLASEAGHTAIIVALVEEGNANVNKKGGKKGDTPLMLSAQEGHKEVAQYLLAKGADVTAVDSLGNSALTVAKTPSLVRMLEDAWTEQTRQRERDIKPSLSTEPLAVSEDEDECKDEDEEEVDLRENRQGVGVDTPADTPTLRNHSFFITDRQMSVPSMETDYADSPVDDGPTPIPMNGQTPDPILPVSEAEADDELESDILTRRTKPATRRNQIRQTLEDTIHKRSNFPRERTERCKDSPRGWENVKNLSSIERRRSSSLLDGWGYSSADEDDMRLSKTEKQHSRQEKMRISHGEQRLLKDRQSQGRNVVLQRSLSSLSQSLESLNQASPILKHVPTNMAEEQHGKRMSLPSVHGVCQSGEQNVSSPVSRLIKSSSVDHLPTLPTNLKPVALLTVDGESERMQVHKYDQNMLEQRNKPLRSNSKTYTMKQKKTERPMADNGAQQHRYQRQKSRSHKFQGRNRQSTLVTSQTLSPCPSPQQKTSGSVMPHKFLANDERFAQGARKVPLLPSVVAPNLSSGLNAISPQKQSSTGLSTAHHRPVQPRASRSSQPALQSGRLPQPPSSLNLVISPQLPVVSEDSESSSSDKTITPSSLIANRPGSPTTLKSPTVATARSSSSTGSFQPDSTEGPVGQAQELVSPHTSQPSNLVVNYALDDNSRSLSPIWKQMQMMRSESESSSSSCGDYITSYIGRKTPFPHNLLSPDAANATTRKVAGTDSGHGESDEEPRHNSSSSDDEEMSFKCELKWKKGQLLGKGAFGKVWEGLMDSAKLIAVKEVELDVTSQERAQTQFKKIQLEVDILRSLRHKNIVRYWGASMNSATIFIFMEYVSGGSLQSILRRFGALDERTIAFYTRQIARGLDYLHYNGIIHRDIKGANIMLTSKGVIKLIDFGCAKRHCQEVSIAFHSVRGTPYWMAPEVICGHGYGRKSDIWSLGCTVHEMAVEKPPWGDYPPEAAMFQIGIGTSTPHLPDTFSEELATMFNSCLQRNPSLRPTARELLEDPFLVLHAQNTAERRKHK